MLRMYLFFWIGLIKMKIIVDNNLDKIRIVIIIMGIRYCFWFLCIFECRGIVIFFVFFVVCLWFKVFFNGFLVVNVEMKLLLMLLLSIFGWWDLCVCFLFFVVIVNIIFGFCLWCLGFFCVWFEFFLLCCFFWFDFELLRLCCND